MKNFTIFIAIAIVSGLFACGNNSGEACYESNKQFSELVSDLNEQFSENAGFQSIMISYDKIMGNTILVKVARDINKNEIEEWFYMNGDWEKKDNSTLETGNRPISDFLFSLKTDYDITQLMPMVKKSKEKLKSELKVQEVICKSVNLLMRNNRVSENKMDDLITQIALEPANGNGTYNVSLDARGNIKDLVR